MEEAQRCIEEVKASDAASEAKTSELKQLEADYNKYKEQFEKLVEEVKSLCSE